MCAALLAKRTPVPSGNFVISGSKKKGNRKDEEKQYFRNEIIYGDFSRSFSLPEDINPDNVEAQFENGILKIAIGKREIKTAKERNIEIK